MARTPLAEVSTPVRKRRMVWMIALSPVLLVVGFVVFCNAWVMVSTHGRIFHIEADAPENSVGVVLGTNKNFAPNRLNLHFTNRVEAAAKLYNAGKVAHLLVSGAHNSDYYKRGRGHGQGADPTRSSGGRNHPRRGRASGRWIPLCGRRGFTAKRPIRSSPTTFTYRARCFWRGATIRTRLVLHPSALRRRSRRKRGSAKFSRDAKRCWMFTSCALSPASSGSLLRSRLLTIELVEPSSCWRESRRMPTLDDDTRQEIEARLLDEIADVEERVVTLEKATEPVSPDKAIGRLSRLESMNEKSVHEAALNQARERLGKMEVALTRVYDTKFGIWPRLRRCDPHRATLAPAGERAMRRLRRGRWLETKSGCDFAGLTFGPRHVGKHAIGDRTRPLGWDGELRWVGLLSGAFHVPWARNLDGVCRDEPKQRDSKFAEAEQREYPIEAPSAELVALLDTKLKILAKAAETQRETTVEFSVEDINGLIATQDLLADFRGKARVKYITESHLSIEMSQPPQIANWILVCERGPTSSGHRRSKTSGNSRFSISKPTLDPLSRIFSRCSASCNCCASTFKTKTSAQC